MVGKTTQMRLDIAYGMLSRQYISLIELGNETPSLKVANEIAMSLDTCIYSIFDLEGTGDFKCPCCGCGN